MRKRKRLFSPVDLEILVGMAEGKTQTDIAKELRLEQPAISKHLASLKRKAGTLLIQRAGRTMTLSPTGRSVSEAAKVVLALLDDIEATVTSQHSDHGGFVRIVACSTPGAYVLPQIVAEFLRTSPHVKVEIDVRPLTQLWNVLQQSAYDYAVIPQASLPVNLWVEPLYSDPIVIFAHPSHRLAKARRVTIEDLQHETLIGRFQTGYWQSVLNDRRSNVVQTAKRIELVSLEGAKQMVATGLGIGVLFRSAVAQEIESGRFRQLAFSGEHLSQLFCLVHRADLAQTPVAKRFGRFLLDRLPALMA